MDAMQLVVITGVERLTPAERWSRLIAPLAHSLQSSGLGEVADLSSLRQEFEQTGEVDVKEVSVRLKNSDYGRPVVDQAARAAGLNPLEISRPERWKSFGCDDYFESTYCRTGYFDDADEYWYIEPYERVFENEDAGFLEVGGAGFDGIRFGYRREHKGLWAYSIDGEFVPVGETVDSFLKGFLTGAIRIG